MKNTLLKILLSFTGESRRLKLLDKNKCEKFITKQKLAIDKMKDEKNKKVPIINLSVGYFYNNQVDTAISTLEKLEVSTLSEQVKSIYYNNLLTYYIHANNKDMVDMIFSQGQLYLQELKNININVYNYTFANYYAYKFMYKESKELLWQNENIKKGPREEISDNYLKAVIHYGLEEINEAEKILEILSNKKLSPKDRYLVDTLKEKYKNGIFNRGN